MPIESQNTVRSGASTRPTDASDIRRQQETDVILLLQQYRETQAPELRGRILTQYANLVESVARRFSGSSEPLEDLAQEGYIGLLTAIDLYDPTKKVKFSTYATHFIIGQIKHYLRDRGKIIKEPAWLQEVNQRMTRTIDSLAQQLSRPPTNLEIARLMDMTEEAVADMMMTREVFKVSSIDGGSDSEEDNGGTVDIERKAQTDVSVSFQLPVEERIVLDTAMLKLKELEQHVVYAFYFKDLNQTEIARQMGISCNYVSHILRNATKKLRQILTTEELRATQWQLTQIRQRLEQQQSQQEQVTIVDGLTRLYNRHYYEMRLQEELSRASRSQADLSVVFVTFSGLDALGRTQGTLKRDDALLKIAALLKQSVRRVDIVTRYDEQKFALILPFTGRKVTAVTDRITAALHVWLAESDWRDTQQTVHFGVGSAVCPHDTLQAGALSELAQAAAETVQAVVSLPRAA